MALGPLCQIPSILIRLARDVLFTPQKRTEFLVYFHKKLSDAGWDARAMTRYPKQNLLRKPALQDGAEINRGEPLSPFKYMDYFLPRMH